MYGSFYDSLDPQDSPSRVPAGDGKADARSSIVTSEVKQISAILDRGVALILPDVEGPQAAFAAGPLYGTMTLDAMRAVDRYFQHEDALDYALVGHSGGAIASLGAPSALSC